MRPDRRWYALGRFQIMAKPLETNPYWQTHHIYLKGECIGKQLSVPSEADCEWHATQHGGRIAARSIPVDTYAIHRKAGPGRPRRHRNYREWLTELA